MSVVVALLILAVSAFLVFGLAPKLTGPGPLCVYLIVGALLVVYLLMLIGVLSGPIVLRS